MCRFNCRLLQATDTKASEITTHAKRQRGICLVQCIERRTWHLPIKAKKHEMDHTKHKHGSMNWPTNLASAHKGKEHEIEDHVM